MTTPTTEPTTAQVDAALNYAEWPLAEGHAKILAAEVRRLREELERIQAIADGVDELFTWDEKGRESGTWQVRIGRGVAKLRADLLSWQGNCQRMADQHGDLSKELGQALSDLAALASAADDLRASVGNFTIYKEVARAVAAYDAARSGAQVADVAELTRDKALLEFIRTRCKVIYFPVAPAYYIEHSLAANKDQWAAISDAAMGGGK